MNTWTFLIAVVFFGVWASVTVAAPVAQVTVRVVDEQGQAIEGAQVSIAFVMPVLKPEGTGLGAITDLLEGLSDSAGYFTGTVETDEEILSIHAVKEGYYKSTDGVPNETILNTELNRWDPWNPTVTVKLKKIRNPVPMYHKQTDWIKVPVFETPVGYDLLQGDWVAPYGKGKHSHFVFIVHQTQTPTGTTYTLSFSHPGDGIQPYVVDPHEQSWFEWPFEAPENGYAATMSREKIYRVEGQPETNLKDDNEINYIFRVHHLDEQKNILSVMYGKIEGEISLTTKGDLKFSYYLNPDGTPNLEENSARNLFDEVPPPARSLRQMILDRQKGRQSQP